MFAFHLSQELRRKQQDVQVAYLYPYNGVNGLPIGSSDILLNGFEGSVFEKFPGVHPLLLRRIRRLIADFRPHVVQVNGSRTVKYGAFARYLSGKPSWVLIYRNIGNPQDWVIGRSRRVFYQKIVMPEIDGIIGVSKTTLQRVISFYRLDIPTVQIPRGIEISPSAPLASPQEIRKSNGVPVQSKIVLFAGSLTEEKRLDRFLRIIQKLQLQLPDLHAWIAGEGPLRTELEKQVSSMELKPFVQFLGVRSDLPSIMNASDLLLLTSDTEGIPGVILEAGAVGLTVVATSVGGVSECILDDQTGVLVDPQDEERMADAALQLLTNAAKRKEMGCRASTWIAENFDIGQIASRYLDFYNHVLKASQR